MRNTVPQTQQQCIANLETLHRELKELAIRAERQQRTERKQDQEARGAVLVIRGK